MGELGLFARNNAGFALLGWVCAGIIGPSEKIGHCKTQERADWVGPVDDTFLYR